MSVSTRSENTPVTHTYSVNIFNPLGPQAIHAHHQTQNGLPVPRYDHMHDVAQLTTLGATARTKRSMHHPIQRRSHAESSQRFSSNHRLRQTDDEISDVFGQSINSSFFLVTSRMNVNPFPSPLRILSNHVWFVLFHTMSSHHHRKLYRIYIESDY